MSIGSLKEQSESMVIILANSLDSSSIELRVWDPETKKYLRHDQISIQLNLALRSDRTETDIRIQFRQFNQQEQAHVRTFTAPIPELYTGLNDADGVEIYEGDIVEQRIVSPNGEDDEERYNYSGVVKMLDGMWTTDAPSRHMCIALRQDEFEPHVIGNVHENPEMLEEGK